MKCRGNQLMMRTFLVRALSFSAAAAMTLNPAMVPAVAGDYRAAPAATAAPAAADGMNARFLPLGVGKSILKRVLPTSDHAIVIAYVADGDRVHLASLSWLS